MAFAIFPRYKDIYEGETPSVTELLSDIPSVFTISAACYINSEKYLNFLDVKVDNRLFHFLIERLSFETQKGLDGKMEDLYNRSTARGSQFTIFPILSMLRLIEHEIINFKQGEFVNVTKEQEEQFLKAILVFNEIEEKEYVAQAKKVDTTGELDTLVKWVWTNLLPSMEFQGRKEILLPLHYSISFFKYLDSNKKFKPFLADYYKKNNVSGHVEFLRNLFAFYFQGFNKQEERFHFRANSSILRVNSVIGEYILDISSFEQKTLSANFKQLREKPIIKFPDGNLFITNWNFFVDKYYQAQKFDFFNKTGVSELYKGNENQKFQAFNGEVGLDFIEKKIFNDTMIRYLSQAGGTIILEDKSKGWNQDLYYRFDNHICFIEFKSVGLPISNDFEEIKKSVDDEGKVKKAVVQLKNQIEKLSQNIDRFEKMTQQGYTKERLIIYPCIVYTDIAWSMYGINEYFNRLFKEEIKGKDCGFFSIEDLVMIHIDFFFNYERIFLEDKISLHTVFHKHSAQRAIFAELFKRNGDVVAGIKKYANSDFYLSNAYPNKTKEVFESSLFESVLGDLGISSKVDN